MVKNKKEKDSKHRIQDSFSELNILDVELSWDSGERPEPPPMIQGNYLRIHIAEEYVDQFAEILETLAEVEGMTDKFISQATNGMAYTDEEVQELEEKE